MSKTDIEWSEESWNPIGGCSIHSPGCNNCYAMRHAHRWPKWYGGLTKSSKRGRVWTGEIRLLHERLTQPLRWKKPRRIFISMSDLFHEDVPDWFISQVFAVMDAAKQHTFQILTKRAKRMAEFCHRVDFGCEALARDFIDVEDPTGRDHQFDAWPLPNVWLGVSVEDQERAAERIPLLLGTPAAVRWVSAEPLIGPVNLTHLDADSRGIEDFYQVNALSGDHKDMGRPCRMTNTLDWVVVGGESGPSARPMALGWAKDLVLQCKDNGIPVFVKQLGAYPVRCDGVQYPITDNKGADMSEWPEELRVREYPSCQV